MSTTDITYSSTLKRLLNKPIVTTRSGNVHKMFGTQSTYKSVFERFPLLTTKKVHFKSIVVELLWFLRGDTNTKYLNDHGVTIWDEWADEKGDLGRVYGAQWRSWAAPYGQTVDQITNLIEGLKNDPHGRRHIVSAWNPAELDQMALPPCHCLFQFFVDTDDRLHCQLYQRSADWFLGVPFNIASYALLLILIARETGYQVGDFIHTTGDTHLYENHINQANELLQNNPYAFKEPQIKINSEKSIFELTPDDIELINYQSYPLIKAPVSV